MGQLLNQEGDVSPHHAMQNIWARLCPAPWAGVGSVGYDTHLLCWDCWGLGALDPSVELEGLSLAFQNQFGLNAITFLLSRARWGWWGYHRRLSGLMFLSVCP